MTDSENPKPIEDKPSEDRAPPYIPWKTFQGFLARWKNATIPHQIDRTVMPTSMDGTTRRQLRSALKFLGLTDNDEVITDKFGILVNALNTPQWKVAVLENVLPAYSDIIGDLPLENGTAAQLDARFRTKGKVEGQMLRKTVRFYLQALKEAGVPFSSHFASKRESADRPRKRNGGSAGNGTTGATERESLRPQKPSLTPDEPAADMISIPIYSPGKPPGKITIHADMNEADCEMIHAILMAYAKRRKEAD